MLPELDTLDTMTPPFDLLDLKAGDAQTLDLVRAELGKAKITPRDGRPPKVEYNLRVWVTPGTKPTIPDWWDITSKTVIAQMLAYWLAGDFPKAVYKITKFGQGPAARFSLDRLPRP